MLLSSALVYLLFLATASSSTTTKEDETPGPCSPLQLIFLDSTGESPRPGIVGRPLSTTLGAKYPGPQGTNRTRSGADLTVRYITNQAKHCPNQRFAIGGYGLGARVIHKMKLPKYLKAKVVAIVVFGDLYHHMRLPSRMRFPSRIRLQWPIESPKVNRKPILPVGFENSQNVASFCISSDPVCLRGTNLVTHVSYGKEVIIARAAEFIASRMRVVTPIS